MIQLVKTNSRNPDFHTLVGMLDEELHQRNGKSQDQYTQYNQIPDISTVVIAYHNNIPAGCGCFKELEECSIEVKRMYVHPAHRGKGISRMILETIEDWALEKGFQIALLETGKNQSEAIGLYQSAGYKRIQNYGPYAGFENSLCMRKELLPGNPA